MYSSAGLETLFYPGIVRATKKKRENEPGVSERGENFFFLGQRINVGRRRAGQMMAWAWHHWEGVISIHSFIRREKGPFLRANLWRGPFTTKATTIRLFPCAKPAFTEQRFSTAKVSTQRERKFSQKGQHPKTDFPTALKKKGSFFRAKEKDLDLPAQERVSDEVDLCVRLSRAGITLRTVR